MSEDEMELASVGLDGGCKKVTALVVGAEGEALTIEARRQIGPWQFRTAIDSRTLSLFTDELGNDTLQESRWTEGWNRILEFLDKDGSWRLSPRFVHPEFAEAVRNAVAERALPQTQVRAWMRAIEAGSRNEQPWRSRDVFTVDVRACGPAIQGLLLGCSAIHSVQALLDLLFTRTLHREVPERSYGDAWVLDHLRTRDTIKQVGRPDRRSLADIEVIPGDVLRVRLLMRGEGGDYGSLEDL